MADYKQLTVRHAAQMITALTCTADHPDSIKSFISDFLITLDKDVHLLGDGDFLEWYQAALQRRGKVPRITVEEVVQAHETKEARKAARKGGQ